MSVQVFIPTIALLIALGKFLDGEHLDGATKEAVRLKLIAFYVYLYDFPSALTKLRKAILEHVFPHADESMTNPKESKSKWFYRLYWILLAPTIAIGFAFLAQAVFKETEWSLSVGLSREMAWWLALPVGIVFGAAWPLIFATLVAMLFVVVFSVSLLAYLVVEVIRRTALLVLNKATSPKTSPFSYFTGLLSVILAGIVLVQNITS